MFDNIAGPIDAAALRDGNRAPQETVLIETCIGRSRVEIADRGYEVRLVLQFVRSSDNGSLGPALTPCTDPAVDMVFDPMLGPSKRLFRPGIHTTI